MADKKVERSGRERPLNPVQKMRSSLSDTGNVNMAEPAHDKGKSALVDKFREREDRWRREQALHDRESMPPPEQVPPGEQDEQGTAEAGEPVESKGQLEGGDS
jgi:hypothetical protein